MRWSNLIEELSIGLLMLAYVALNASRWHSLWEPLSTLIFAVLLGLPSILAHELGHVVAGRVLGLKLDYIHVGTRSLFSVGSRLQIGANPFLGGGFTSFQNSSKAAATRQGILLMSSAGALVNLLLIFLALFVIPIAPSLGWGLLIINFAQALDNVIPKRSRQIAGSGNDGARLWAAVFGRR